ncbi:MAG TPA: hypothetical protein VH413_15970 [Verrucomicrobiae bacterium]|jgi:hypothetical protein|nr:hypothetical protein [Verrucomicrobiae bacterium]
MKKTTAKEISKKQPVPPAKPHRFNVYASDEGLELINICMKHRRVDNRSFYLLQLVREDWERRGRPSEG